MSLSPSVEMRVQQRGCHQPAFDGGAGDCMSPWRVEEMALEECSFLLYLLVPSELWIATHCFSAL